MLRSRLGGVQGLEVPQERLKNEEVAPRALLQRSREGTRERLPLPKGSGAERESRGEEHELQGACH